MCKKCHYKIKMAINCLGDTPETCFMQIGFRASNQLVREAVNFIAKSLISNRPLDGILECVKLNLRQESEKDQSAYQEAMDFLPFFASNEPQSEEVVYNGLFNGEEPETTTEAQETPAEAIVDKDQLQQSWDEAENEPMSKEYAVTMPENTAGWD